MDRCNTSRTGHTCTTDCAPSVQRYLLVSSVITCSNADSVHRHNSSCVLLSANAQMSTASHIALKSNCFFLLHPQSICLFSFSNIFFCFGGSVCSEGEFNTITYHRHTVCSSRILQVFGTKRLDELPCVYLHGTFLLAHPVGRTRLLAQVLEQLLKLLQPVVKQKRLM